MTPKTLHAIFSSKTHYFKNGLKLCKFRNSKAYYQSNGIEAAEIFKMVKNCANLKHFGFQTGGDFLPCPLLLRAWGDKKMSSKSVHLEPCGRLNCLILLLKISCLLG